MRDDLGVIADRLARTMDAWRSIELKERRDNESPEPAVAKTLFDQYVETALGQRRYEFAVPATKDQPGTSYLYYADGRRFANEVLDGGRQTMVEFKRAFGHEDQRGRINRGMTLTHLYFDQKPLHAALRDARSLGSSRRLGRECEVALLVDKAPASKLQEIVYELDRETGIPLAVRSYATEADRAADRPRTTWEATSFRGVGEGRFWPMTVAKNFYKPGADGKPELMIKSKITVESLKFDQDYPESLFWPTLQPGATVWDKIEGKHWVVPGEAAPAKAATPAVSVPAAPPRSWTAAGSTVGLSLGIALVGVGGFLWWRRR